MKNMAVKYRSLTNESDNHGRKLNTAVYKWFQNLQSGSKPRRTEGFNHRNIFNISSIESLGPTQKLGLRGGFETTSRQSPMTPNRV